MVRSSTSFESNDVLIQCRVRRSDDASHDSEFGQAIEMTCAMRNWPSKKSKRKASSPGPELLLRQDSSIANSLNTLDRKSEPFQSFGCSRSRRMSFTSPSESERFTPPRRSSLANPRSYNIPASNVDLVHYSHLIFITSRSLGYFEFSFVSDNARDMMVAFLTASLPDEKIVSTARDMDQESVEVSLDVEALTAKRIQERMRQETLGEKVKRKVTHVALQLEELTSAISECGCGGSSASFSLADEERRQSPPRDGSSDDREFPSQAHDELAGYSSKDQLLDLALEPELESVHAYR